MESAETEFPVSTTKNTSINKEAIIVAEHK
jgi:hypothetical protein